MPKIGIFGGAFDPPHLSHVSMITQAAKELKLEKVLILPVGTPPHKNKCFAGFEHRAEMCRVAFEDYENFEICDIENTGEKNYTIATVRKLKELYSPDTVFYLIIGGDTFFAFEKWRKYKNLLEECQVVAVSRENYLYSDMLEYATKIGHIKVLNLNVKAISSTEIREKIKNNCDINDFLNPKVLAYIKKEGLYI